MRKSIRQLIGAVGLAVVMSGLGTTVLAMDRWSALSQIESGDKDEAVGAAGEVSRYQIKPEVWRRYAPSGADWARAEDALGVAKEVMRQRCVEFERSFHRAPTDFEFYILWNAPAQVERPSGVVAERAGRFRNLVAEAASPPVSSNAASRVLQAAVAEADNAQRHK